MIRKRKPKQIDNTCHMWWVRFENGDAYFMPAHNLSALKQRIVKYCPSMYCIDDKPNFIHSDDWKGK
jgi:hypothetical protein